MDNVAIHPSKPEPRQLLVQGGDELAKQPRAERRPRNEVALERAVQFLNDCPAREAREFGEALIQQLDADQRELFLAGLKNGQALLGA